MGKIAVIGGGLAGLSSAIGLAKSGLEVTLIEKKEYPFHKVCGEYVSNEVLPFLASLGADINSLNPARIQRFQLSSQRGKVLEAPLDLGGFGISRYTLDNYLYGLAQKAGVQFKLRTTVETVAFSAGKFTLYLSDGSELQSEVAIGAFGKRSNLDRQLNRSFFASRSPYLAVKYHLHANLPTDLIALHNFENGYAGISAIEDEKFCFCYLTTRNNLKRHGTIPEMEKKVLSLNPFLKEVFRESEFLYGHPEVINEISFAPKTAVTDHILCAGDAAGLITPLCGNGMAMALHSGKMLTEAVKSYFLEHGNRQQLEENYTRAWQKQFGNRLRSGRFIQQLFGKKLLSEASVFLFRNLPFALTRLMKSTHGRPF